MRAAPGARPLRIAIGGFQHESHSFAPMPTGWAQFAKPGGFPPLQRAATLVDTMRTTSVPIAGAIAMLEAAGATIVPLAWNGATLAGRNPLSGAASPDALMRASVNAADAATRQSPLRQRMSASMPRTSSST